MTRVPPFWNAACQRADTTCQDNHKRYTEHPLEENWETYLHNQHARAETAQHRNALFIPTSGESGSGPHRRLESCQLTDGKGGVDLHGVITTNVSGHTAKTKFLARFHAPPTTGPSLRLPRHAAPPQVTLPELGAALTKTHRKGAPDRAAYIPSSQKQDWGRDAEFSSLQ